jgi:hypothetical protein
MAVNKYYQVVLDTFQGQTDDLKPIPRERLDWAGPGAMLDLFRRTSGSDRTEIVRAIAQIISDHPAPPAVIAQLVSIASSLDLAEVEPEVRKLQSQPISDKEPLKGAIINFLAFRQLAARVPTEPTEPAVAGQISISRSRPRRSKAASFGNGKRTKASSR